MYFVNLIINFLLIINIGNFLKYHLKIETKKIFLISFLIIITISYILSFLLNIKTIFYLYVILNIFILLCNFRYKFLINSKTLKYFICFYFVFGFLIFERYFLDYDEFTYWGIVLKYFGYSLDQSILLDRQTSWQGYFAYFTEFIFNLRPFYHPTGIPIFISLNTFITGYAENNAIFFNNLICLAGFFYLFFDKNKNIQNIFKFLIFYLLLNNLSFGMISIYVDPIISIIFACVLYEIFNKKINYISLIILTLSLLAIHRSGFIFAIYSLAHLFLLNQKKISLKLVVILILLTLLSMITNYSVLANLEDQYLTFNYLDLLNYLKKSLFIPIYFSSFGSWINTIFIIFNFNIQLSFYQLSIFFWFIAIILLIMFSRGNKYIYVSFILLTFSHLLILFFEKINSTGYSLLVVGRYMGLLFLSYLLFINSIIKFNFKSYFIIILLFIIITPAKTFGIFVPQKIYLLSDENQKFYKNRNNIKIIFSKYNKNDKQIVIIDTEKLRENISKEKRDFYIDIIKYEIYPKKIIIINGLNKNKIDQLSNMNIYDFYSINLNKEQENYIKGNILFKNIKYINVKLL